MVQFNRGNKSEAFRVVVSGDLGAYTKGDVLTKDMDIADYLRTGYDEGADKPYTGTDDQILAIAKSIPFKATEGEDPATEGSSDWEIEIQEIMESRSRSNEMTGSADKPLPDTRSDVAIASVSGTTAHLVAAKLDANPHFREWLLAGAYAPEGVKVSPLNMLRGYLEVYGLTPDNDGYVSGFEKSILFQEIPSPDAKPSESYLKDHGDKVAKADYKKFAEFKLSNGETYNWYEDAFDNMELGKTISAELKAISDGSPGAGKQTKTRTGEYASISLSHLKIKRDLWNTRRTAALKCLKQGIAACYQWRDVLVDMAGRVGVKFAMDNRGKPNATISEGFSTIIVYDKRSPEFATPYSVSGFNNLDVAKANGDGVGTYDDLIASTETGQRNKDKTTIFSPEFLKKSPTDRFIAIMPDLQTWIEGMGVTASLLSACNKRSKAEDAEFGFDRAANNLKLQIVEFARKFNFIVDSLNKLGDGEFMAKLETKRVEEERAADEKARKLIANEKVA